MDSRYSSGQLTVHVYDIINFDEGESDDFIIETRYDGTILDTSSNGSPRQKAVTDNQAEDLTVSVIDFEPRNEGEIATYKFEITPSTSFTST